MRIASLVPSISESLCVLGLPVDALVARTEWCARPAGPLLNVAACGGTKNPRIAEIIALRPDLVLMDEEENRREDFDALCAAGLRVHSFAVRCVEDAAAMLRELGVLCALEERGRELALELEDALSAARTTAAAFGAARPRLIPLIWHQPLMSVAASRYSGDLLAQAGFEVCGDITGNGYPRWTLDTLAQAAPDVLLLSQEPHDFTESEAAALHEAMDARGCPEVRVVKWEAGHELTWFGASSTGALRAFARLRAQW